MSRTGSWLVAAAAASMAFVACAKLVGITDTPVTRADSPDASAGTMGGAGGDSPTDVTTAPGLAGSGGNGGGGDAPLSSTGGSAGSGGTPAVASMDAGPSETDAGSGGCIEQATRCGAAGREVCSAGSWQPQACPLAQPACDGEGQCVVRGPALVSVGNYFIHATEVTVSQYGAFLTAKNGDVSGQRDVCSWNQSYWEYDEHPVMAPGNQPIGYVDWCDATAYCSWAGMRLCGRIGGGALARDEVFDTALDQWYVACGGPNGGVHPNNNAMCNPTSDIAAVASYPGCEGYYPGLFDMQGNVAEWVDGCDGNTGPDDICYLMGGNITDNGGSFCDEVYNAGEDAFPRNDKAFTFGFRCCSG